MNKRSIGFTGLLNLVIIVLKLCGIIPWSWLIVIPAILVISVIPFVVRVVFIYLIESGWFS